MSNNIDERREARTLTKNLIHLVNGNVKHNLAFGSSMLSVLLCIKGPWIYLKKKPK